MTRLIGCILGIALVAGAADARPRHGRGHETPEWLRRVSFGFLDSGFVVDHLALDPAAHAGLTYNAIGTSRFHTTSAGGSLWAVGYRTGLRYYGDHVVLGVEIAVADALGAPTSVTTVEGYSAMTSNGGDLFDVDGYGGVHTRVGPVDFSTSLAIGHREIYSTVSLPDGFTGCVGGVAGRYCGVANETGQALIEYRAGVDLWVTGHFTIGASAGYDVLHSAESFALELHEHFE